MKPEDGRPDPPRGLATALARRLGDLFGKTGETLVALAPGRVNLIGEHTDYNDGWALPMAIDRYVGVAFRARGDRRLRVHAAAFGETREVDLDALEVPAGPQGAKAHRQGWVCYLAGMAWAMIDSGMELAGIDCVIDGNVPQGAGLSSSAALEMATARALCQVSSIPWSPKIMADLGRRAENSYVGVSCGCMDQVVSSCAQQNRALLLDCRTLETEAVPIPPAATVIVMDTGSRRSLAASEYNDRRSSCGEAVEALRRLRPGITALRDVEPELLERARSRMSATTWRRAEHVVHENLRPAAMAAALSSGALEEAGRLMNDSHAGLRDLYQVSSPELDLITDLARRHPDCFGARLTGAGFGGCAVALVATGGAEDFVKTVRRAYAGEVALPSEIFPCEPVAGARLCEPAEITGTLPRPVGLEQE